MKDAWVEDETITVGNTKKWCWERATEKGTLTPTASTHQSILHPTSSSSSLQHELFEVIVQNGVLDIPEHQPDVLSVDGCGEVVVQWLVLLLAALFAEALHQEALDICQAGGVT